MHLATTNCRIETFDCTVEGIIPHHIKSRTRFHRVCLGKSDDVIDGKVFMSWKSLNSLVGRTTGTNYLKMDIEGITIFILKELL